MNAMDNDALRAAYLKGFQDSAQGWNGEHGCDEPESDDYFCERREKSLFGPQEPERQEGYYWVTVNNVADVIGRLIGKSWWIAGTKFDDERVKATSDRLYQPHEFRPADKCPPPLTGEIFEIEDEHTDHFITLIGDEYRVLRESSKGTNSLWWLRDKRWRPQQVQS